MDIIRQLREAHGQTSFCEQTNETHFPAKWNHGEGARDAGTSVRGGDARIAVAAQHVANEMGILREDWRYATASSLMRSWGHPSTLKQAAALIEEIAVGEPEITEGE